MSRHSSQSSYNHNIRFLFRDGYELGWTVDRYYAGSRLRFPTSFQRSTDEAGARRFAKKWDIPMPEPHTDK